MSRKPVEEDTVAGTPKRTRARTTRPPVERAELTELEQAQKVIDQARGERMQEFVAKLSQLCDDYGVDITPQATLGVKFREAQ